MANRHLSTTLATFEARVHKTKNRQISIPADTQRQLRLLRQVNNHLVLYSIRKKGEGRWNHHWAQLTFDNEFAIPADVVHIDRGDAVEVKIHRVVQDIDALHGNDETQGGAALLLQLAEIGGEDERVDGSRAVDEYLYGPGDA
jgi:hypothetical protein